MKTKIELLPCLLTVFMSCSVMAQIMVDPAYFYDQCMQQANLRYAYCVRSGPYNGPCANMRSQEQTGCRETFQNMRGGGPGYGPQAYDGRFYPTPIPQRPVYVMPGSR